MDVYSDFTSFNSRFLLFLFDFGLLLAKFGVWLIRFAAFFGLMFCALCFCGCLYLIVVLVLCCGLCCFVVSFGSDLTCCG